MLSPLKTGSNGFHEHEMWTRMCALLTADALSSAELQELNEHLETCPECREAAAEFQKISRVGMPLLLADAPPAIDENSEWPEEHIIRKRLLSAIDGEQQEEFVGAVQGTTHESPVLRYLALVVVALLIGSAGFFIGSRSRVQPKGREVQADSRKSSATVLASQIAQLTKQRDDLLDKASREGKEIDDLAAELAEQTQSISHFRQELEQSNQELQSARDAGAGQTSKIADLQSQNTSLKSEREGNAHQLQESQSSLVALRQDLTRLQEQHTADLLESATMQKTIEDLSGQVRSNDAVVSEQKQFLASDRDIRELMGARDLLIADVSDVDKDGNSRGPFGRVFYTKNKSLVFYAFDLEKHPALRDVKAFQAWGQKSSDASHPLNLGIFFMDNEANRRWVLKFDNPKLMEQVDAVFVTVEPRGGSDTPHGKQLMYAYLRTPANHP